LRIY
jgi:hypothetical protein